MEISCQLICECNNKLYKSVTSLKAHRKTQGHQFWEQNKEQKEISIKINRLEIENTHLRRLNVLLLERINSLEQSVKK
jgi:hypothetical protein